MGSFLEDFDEFLDCVFPKYDKFLICGDVNIQLDKKSAVSTEFVRILASYGLNQLINEPTHKAGHTLDMVTTSHKIIDNSTLQVLSDTLEIFKSCDHFPIIFTLQCKTLRSNDKKKIQFRSIEKIDKDRFSFDLLDKLARNKSFSTFEEHLDHYNATCSEVLDIHAPLLEKVIKDVPSAPWFDSEYKAARVARRKAEKVWLKSHLPIDRDIFNHLRLHCTELASSKKKLFFQGHFEKYSHSTKGLYKFVDVFLDNDAALKLPPTESLQDTVEEFNTFFTEKIKAIREAFSNSTLNEDPVAKVPVDIDSKLCEFRETSVEELKDILKSVKIKSCLADPLPAELVKDNLSILLPQLCELVNLSLSTGCMDGAKSALLTPLLKNDSLDSSNLKNYRPVSNLAFVGKIIEKVVQIRLEEHMKKNKLDMPFQSAYKKNHSTETLLIRVVNDLLIASDEGKATVVMLLDLSAAFDTVDHNKLLDILYREIGVSGTALAWFRSYLSGRCQRVRVGTHESVDITIKFGVPQGSVLGPILFNIYIRSLYATVHSQSFNIHGFADDHQIYKAFQSAIEHQIMTEKIPQCFAEITKWMKSHYLQLNPGKTEIMVFGNQKTLSKLQIKGVFISPGVCIRLVSVAKNLGFYLDSTLDFTTQIKKLKSSCFNKLRHIAKMKKFLNIQQLQQLVSALIFSNLDYCNAIYYGASSKAIKQLQSIQNRACATILGLKRREPKSEHLKKLHWLKVLERIEFKILLVTYKALNGIAPDYISDLVKYYNLSGSRSPSLQTHVSKTSYGDRAFISCAAKLWNRLPEAIRTSPSVKTFKTQLKTHLFKKSFPT